MAADKNSVIAEFNQVVNMTPKELESWLNSEASQQVGQKDGGDESIGHKSGQRIVKLLNQKKSNYTEDDLHHMHRVISYVQRHSAQRPARDVEHTRWRYSLMNWGHDPLK